jgi:cysteine desulfurase/selenocysteine lyase
MSEAIRQVRALFPGAEKRIYMDVSVRGLLPQPVRDAAERHMDLREFGDGTKDGMREVVESARSAFAALIGAASDEIALTKNVSEGLNHIAGAIEWQEGDNVVVCPELEHPNNVYLWLNLRERRGVDVRIVPAEGGRIPSEAMAAAVDGRTRILTVPTITFSPGFITDLAPLSEACRAHDALFLVDAAQSVGVLETNVDAMGVDALAVATQKGLLSFYGQGFLYCRREWAERLRPASLARFGVDLGADAHETAQDLGDLRFQPGARRFDLGNYNYLGAAAAGASIELLRTLGMGQVEAHCRGLARRLAQGLEGLGLPLPEGMPGPDQAHIVAVGRTGGGRHYSADDPAMNDLHAFLSERGVRFSIRRGILRFSLHIWNTEEEVDRVVGMCGEWGRTAVPAPGAP